MLRASNIALRTQLAMMSAKRMSADEYVFSAHIDPEHGPAAAGRAVAHEAAARQSHHSGFGGDYASKGRSVTDERTVRD